MSENAEKESKTQSFADFKLHPILLEAVSELGWQHPTKVQQAAFMLGLPPSRDAIIISETGSGKTAAFALPILHRILTGVITKPCAIVICPVRELAQQTANVFNMLVPGSALALFGGAGAPTSADQARAIYARPRPRVLVGTPGRIAEHCERTLAKDVLPGIEFLVLDEADRCLSMEQEAVTNVIAAIRKVARPRTMLFSATLTSRVEAVRRGGMEKALEIRVGEGDKVALPAELTLELYTCKDDRVDAALAAVLARMLGRPATTATTTGAPAPAPVVAAPVDDNEVDFLKRRAIVFCNNAASVDATALVLRRAGWRVARMHGSMSQAERENSLKAFRRGRQVLVATGGLAGRGLDLTGVQYVINRELPVDVDEWVHRCGRTARAGARGKAASIVTPDTFARLAAIEKHISRRLTKTPWKAGELDSWVATTSGATAGAARVAMEFVCE